MISITSAPEAPPPKIRILDARNREVETVRIGDKLTFRIEIPEDSELSFFFSDRGSLALVALGVVKRVGKRLLFTKLWTTSTTLQFRSCLYSKRSVLKTYKLINFSSFLF